MKEEEDWNKEDKIWEGTNKIIIKTLIIIIILFSIFAFFNRSELLEALSFTNCTISDLIGCIGNE